MSKWSAWTLTEKGQALEAKVNAGKCKLAFTKIQLGDGTPANLATATSLVNARVTLEITDFEVVSKTVCRLEASCDNSTLTSELVISEMGLLATDPDEGEILYGVATDSEPDIMPAPSGSVAYEQTVRLNVVVSSADDVSVTIDPAAFVTQRSLEAAVEEIKADTAKNLEAAVEEVKQSAADMLGEWFEEDGDDLILVGADAQDNA